jgi:hypothetical protein
MVPLLDAFDLLEPQAQYEQKLALLRSWEAELINREKTMAAETAERESKLRMREALVGDREAVLADREAVLEDPPFPNIW